MQQRLGGVIVSNQRILGQEELNSQRKEIHDSMLARRLSGGLARLRRGLPN